MQNATINIASPILPFFSNFQFLVCVSKLVVGKKKGNRITKVISFLVGTITPQNQKAF